MKRIIYVCFIALFLSSCTSDNDDNLLNEYSNFYALTVGNQWVYKNYKYNTVTQGYDYTGIVDSVSVVGTEVVNDDVYYRFKRFTTGNEDNVAFCNPNGEHFELLRDSLGYLIRTDGSIKYTNNDFNSRSINEQDWGTIYEQLISMDHEIIVEAGTFESTYTQRYAITHNGEQTPGLDHFYYVNGVGLIYDTSSLVTQEIPAIIRRLDSYDVE